jgi:predicted aspartyl protease
MLCPKRPCLLPCLFAVAFLPWTVASLADPAPPGTEQAHAGTGQAGIPPVAQAPAEKPQQSFISVISPLAGHGGPLIRVRLNDSAASATFLVDTGAGSSLIAQSLADRLGLKARPALNADGKPWEPFGKPTDAVPIDALLIEGPPEQPLWRLNLLGGGQFDVATPEQLYLPVDGVLGMEGFESSALLFDFAAGRMDVILPGALSPAQVRSYGFNQPGGAALPLSRLTKYPNFSIKGDSDLFSVPVLLNNGSKTTQADLLVDTGSQVTVIPRAAAKELSLKPFGQRPLAGGTGGSMQANQAQVSSLSLGGIRLTDVPVLYPDRKDHVAILGMDILKNYRVLLDFPGRMMYIQPPDPGFSMPRPDNGPSPVPAPTAPAAPH